MRALAILTLLAVTSGVTACSARDRHDAPTSSSSAFTPVRVSIAPAPSTAWTAATTCPSAAAAKAAFGAQTRTKDTNAKIGGLGCFYGISADASIDIIVIQGTVATNRGIWARPPASIVRDAPELAPGAVLVYTPPGGGLDQCLVAVDRGADTLTVQVTRRDGIADRQRLCAPLGRTLRLLTGR